MYKIKSEKNVLFLKDYEHNTFNAEPNDHLQKMVLQAFSGEMTKSDDRWIEYVEERHKKERIEEEEQSDKGWLFWNSLA